MFWTAGCIAAGGTTHPPSFPEDTPHDCKCLCVLLLVLLLLLRPVTCCVSHLQLGPLAAAMCGMMLLKPLVIARVFVQVGRTGWAGWGG